MDLPNLPDESMLGIYLYHNKIMDLVQLENEKNTQFQQFNDEYKKLHLSYNELLQEALNEQDPKKQSDLIESILQTNTEMAQLVRSFIPTQNKEDVKELTNELLKIQKEYLKIQESKDHKTTLDMILNENKKKVSQLKWEHDILLILIGIAILVILYSVFMISFRMPSIQLPLSTTNPA